METELESLIQTIRIDNQDIGMECGIEKCAMLIMKSRKREITEGIEMVNPLRIGTRAAQKKSP